MAATDTTLSVQLFQQVTVRKSKNTNQPNKFRFRGHVTYYQSLKMITILFTRTMHVCMFEHPIELYHSKTYFAVLVIAL